MKREPKISNQTALRMWRQAGPIDIISLIEDGKIDLSTKNKIQNKKEMDNYEGQMLNMDAHGIGRDVYPSEPDFGFIYEGNFEHTKLNGWGRVIHRNGTVVMGYFKNDELLE